MNIFVLDNDPKLAASYHNNKHVVKMILESSQILCNAFDNIDTPYKKTHTKHPCCIWVKESLSNFNWLLSLSEALGDEFKLRYKNIHKSIEVINWCKANTSKLLLNDIGLTKFALAMPDKYKSDNAVTSYRNYYLSEKLYFSKWSVREIPYWVKEYMEKSKKC